MAEDDGKQGNLAFLKMLKSSALAEEVVSFITDLREEKKLADEVWWRRWDVAITQWLVTEDLKRGWMQILFQCWEDPRPVRRVHGEFQKGDMRPRTRRMLRERFVADLAADVRGRFEGDVLSDTSFAVGPTPWREGRKHSDIGAKFSARVHRKRAR